MAQAVQLAITALEEDFSGSFDVLEVWRSTLGEDGPYSELTAEQWKPARIPKTAGDAPASPVTGASINIVGEELIVRVDEDEDSDFSIVFTGVDPLTLAGVAAQIVTGGLGKLASYVDATGLLVVETTEPGTGAVLRIVESDAAAPLGLPTEEPDSLAYGRDARILLVAGVEQYTFTDQNGDSSYFYKTRFRNKMTGAVSEFSTPLQPQPGQGVASSSLICGVVNLVGQDGKFLRNMEVRVHSAFDGTQVDGYTVAGGDLVAQTDEAGHAEFSLVRGSRATVAIIGTSLVRDITVPDDPNLSSFNLLDPSIGSDDVFKVQVPDVVFAERRSL